MKVKTSEYTVVYDCTLVAIRKMRTHSFSILALSSLILEGPDSDLLCFDHKSHRFLLSNVWFQTLQRQTRGTHVGIMYEFESAAELTTVQWMIRWQ